jgi:rSAM/selenodomain-associated transferase 2
MNRVAAIVPVLNEARGVGAFLAAVCAHDFAEIVVVDGGSDDATVRRVAAFHDGSGDPRLALVSSERGRARQMNAGARRAQSEILVFLHADTYLPPGAVPAVRSAIEGGRQWGRFDVRFDGRGPLLRVIAFFMNWRSRLTGICTGDQTIFVRRDVFERIGGYSDMALMEDIDLSHRLKRSGRPARIAVPVTTSARRWREQGILRTIVQMWRLRLMYFLGASPATLAARYADVRER